MNKGAKGAKKVWQKPELIVLARCNPEEAVLTSCKGDSLVSSTGTTNRTCARGRTLCNVNTTS